MAQRDMKEQEPTELRSPKITLCANSCGFPGNPATQNLCQNCFIAAHATMSAPTSPSTPAPSPSSSSSSSSSPPVVVVDKPTRPAPVAEARAELAAPAAARASSANRCSTCRKRVGLTGFPCRCGELFCGAHRYSDRHGCSFNYKAAGRDAIARENPVVRAAKIVRF